mmetsp:Transcript_23000/g.91218  ORF Transcript_23000/g.91218 Transcript_23000/m.91218 type:complete len:381 (+) Transcript_23000:3-1145(+)
MGYWAQDTNFERAPASSARDSSRPSTQQRRLVSWVVDARPRHQPCVVVGGVSGLLEPKGAPTFVCSLARSPSCQGTTTHQVEKLLKSAREPRSISPRDSHESDGAVGRRGEDAGRRGARLRRHRRRGGRGVVDVHSDDGAAVVAEDAERRARLGAPQADRRVVRARHHEGGVVVEPGGERARPADAVDRLRVAGEAAHAAAAVVVPEPDLAVGRGARDERRRRHWRRHGDVLDEAALRAQRAHAGPRRARPDVDRRVARARDEPAAAAVEARVGDEALDGAEVLREVEAAAARPEVPHAHARVARGAPEPAAREVEDERGDGVGVVAERERLGAPQPRVPEADRVVGRRRHDAAGEVRRRGARARGGAHEPRVGRSVDGR